MHPIMKEKEQLLKDLQKQMADMEKEDANVQEAIPGKMPAQQRLSEADVEYLQELCDKSEFIDYINFALDNLVFTLIIESGKVQPSEINRELMKAHTALRSLSPYAMMHITMVLHTAYPPDGGSIFPRMVDALATPYDRKTFGVHPTRNELLWHTRHIDKHFIVPAGEEVFKDMQQHNPDENIRPAETRQILQDVVQFLIDKSGIEASATSVVNDVRS